MHVFVRLTTSQPPVNWSQLEWTTFLDKDQPNGHTLWVVKIHQSQILSLAECLDVAAIALGGKIGPL